MNKPLCLKVNAVLAVILLLCGAARCRDLSGKEDHRIEKEDRLSEKTEPMPLWKQLDAMSDNDKKNAFIRLEGPANPDPALLRKFAAVENLWNSGGHDFAVERLRSLEQSCDIGLAVGISWLKPKSTSGGKWGDDVQVGDQIDVKETVLDFDEDTGNLFIVLLRDGGSSPCWTMNFSSDGGETWFETYQYSNTRNRDVIDIGAVVVDDYCYVGYAPEGLMYGTYPTGYIRRFFAIDGAHDDAYASQAVISIGEDIREIALTSNTDSSDNRIYYYAIMEDDKIQFYWANEDGMSWASFGPAASGASHSLDVAFNEGYTDNYLAACYVDTSGTVMVALLGSSGWTAVSLRTGNMPSIGAYDDHILVAYQYVIGSHELISYHISHDGGGYFTTGDVTLVGSNWMPAVAARMGGGFAVTWQDERGSFDHCEFEHDDYYAYFQSSSQSYNELDPLVGTRMSIEWVPSGGHNYGAVFIEGQSGSRHAMFDRTDWGTQSFALTISPDPLVSGANATFTVSDGDPNTQTYLTYSLNGPGSTYIPPLDVTLDIDNPMQAGGAIMTDGSGNGSWNLLVPPQAAGMDVWFQALQYQNKTNVVAASVQ